MICILRDSKPPCRTLSHLAEAKIWPGAETQSRWRHEHHRMKDSQNSIQISKCDQRGQLYALTVHTVHSVRFSGKNYPSQALSIMPLAIDLLMNLASSPPTVNQREVQSRHLGQQIILLRPSHAWLAQGTGRLQALVPPNAPRQAMASIPASTWLQTTSYPPSHSEFRTGSGTHTTRPSQRRTDPSLLKSRVERWESPLPNSLCATRRRCHIHVNSTRGQTPVC